jgi:Domain of unknown function (DUF1707)
MADSPDLRASDHDRDQTADALRQHYSAGRLDSDEFEQRLNAAYAARTHGELAALSSDLPALPPPPPTTMEVARRSLASHELVRNATAGGGAFVLATVVWAVTGADGAFWPKWVLVLTAISIYRGFRRRGGPEPRGEAGQSSRPTD